jgi:hypothetical protein
VHQQNFPVFLQPLPYYQLTQLIEVDESVPWTHVVAFFQDAPRLLEVDELLAGPLRIGSSTSGRVSVSCGSALISFCGAFHPLHLRYFLASFCACHGLCSVGCFDRPYGLTWIVPVMLVWMLHR